jgi:nucleoside-diphosphate-sugar epimerase
MRIAVTGATGFVGGAIADHLASAGHEVLAVGRRASPGSVAHEYVAWDLAADAAPPPPELAACDAVVHAAAHVAPWGPEAPFRQVTVAGTQRLLGAVDPAARLVVIGTASVYDPHLPHVLAVESEAPVATGRYLNAYGRAKADQERLVLTARPDAVVLRPRAVWGPGDTTLLPRILARVRRGRLPLPDGGRHRMSTTHVSSLATAVTAALECPQVVGPVNVADATSTTSARLLGMLFDALGMTVRIVSVPTPLAWAAAGALENVWRLAGRKSEPPVTRYAVAGLARPFTLDLGRLHHELGVQPDVDVAEAAERLAAVAVPGFGATRSSG